MAASSKVGDETRGAKATGDYPQLLGGSNLSSSSSSSSGDEDSSNSDGSVAGGSDSESEAIDVDEPVSAGRSQCAPPACEASAESEDADDSDCGNAADDLVNGQLNPALRVPQVAVVNKGDFLPKMQLPISPQGRFMQPAPTVRFLNMLEDLQYAVWISFIQDSGHCGSYMKRAFSPSAATAAQVTVCLFLPCSWGIHAPRFPDARFALERQASLLLPPQAVRLRRRPQNAGTY